MIGISEIANKICNNYPILAREYLGIDISTNNIMEINDFVKAYSSNKFVSAIDKPFLFRNEEMLEIENAFKEHGIVILNGFAGCGKTHLALHYISEYTKNNNIKAYCIRGMNLSIYQDLKIYINKNSCIARTNILHITLILLLQHSFFIFAYNDW